MTIDQAARDHFRNLGREHGRKLAEQGQQVPSPKVER